MFAKNDSDRDWEIWARQNPYFGVLAHPKFLNENINDDSLQQFFLSGQNQIDHIYAVVREKINPDFQPSRVLDYGSGVGRVVIPLAQRSEFAFGVDVSSTMLKIAKENCEKLGASANFIHANDLDSVPTSSLDLVHSSLVFQHIPTKTGELIFRKLISLLTKGGVGVIHFNYADERHLLIQCASVARRNSNLIHKLLNIAQGRSIGAPLMQMNNYSMNRIFNILMDGHCSNLYIEFAQQGKHRGATLYFERG